MLSTLTGENNYPGKSTVSDNWPAFAPGTIGVLNTMAPPHFNASGMADSEVKPPGLWVHGCDDAITSDSSLFDPNYLGQLGVIPAWPGADAAPPQPMKAQTWVLLDRYRDNGGVYREGELEECGHAPHVEHPDAFNQELHAHLR